MATAINVAAPAANLSPDHFAWLVEGRSANQRSTLELYKIIHDNDRILNRDVELQEAAQELTGVAFSLWRAVFLSDTTGEYADQLADVKKFLISLISDNSVQYTTDKNARNWSFRYYLKSATHRLQELSDDGLSLVDKSDLLVPHDSEKDEWVHTQEILDKAITRFSDKFR